MSVRPFSLVQNQADTPAARAARKNVDVDTNPDSDPSAVTDGFHTGNRRWLHITAELNDASTTADLELWLLDEVAGLWYLDTRLGTGGTVTIDQADGVYHTFVEIAQASRAFIKLDNATGVWAGGASDGCSVWLSSSGEA